MITVLMVVRKIDLTFVAKLAIVVVVKQSCVLDQTV